MKVMPPVVTLISLSNAVVAHKSSTEFITNRCVINILITVITASLNVFRWGFTLYSHIPMYAAFAFFKTVAQIENA
jgi:hypothetical protein